MERRIKLTAISIIILVSVSLRGQESAFRPVQDVEGVTSQIIASNGKINSMECTFVQEKELSFLEEKVFSSGMFYFQRENKIRWEYETPYSYIIIMNGNLIKIQDEGKTNTLDASSNRLFSSINTIMSGIIDGTVIQRKDQFNSKFFENDESIRVSLEPLITGMKEFILSFELDMNKEDYTVDAMKIIEKNGDYTLIIFKNKKLNAAIPEDIFSVH